jgi:beta-galactosidase/beta-glucuronidase
LTGEHAYPRPQLQREFWQSLNGEWQFAIDPPSGCAEPGSIAWNATILVPFSPETKASTIGNTGFYSVVWYRRTFESPELQPGERLVLHFGAVDYAATVWVNGQLVCSHAGGYTPFHGEITCALKSGGAQEIVVRAEDDPFDLAKPRGKQDWKLEPHSIWYPRTTGIWQTVWLEITPASFLESVMWTANLQHWEIGMEARIGGEAREDLTLSVRLLKDEYLLSRDTYAVVGREVNRKIAFSDPGIDDFRNEILWSPSRPTLLDVELELRDAEGRVVDRVQSYTALRSIDIQQDRFILNGRPLQLRLVLDQGYWPETGITPPSDEALLADILLVKQMGFNGVRKHQKIEDPRFLYWADRAGLLVWEEMPSAYRYTRSSIERLTEEWIEVIKRDSSHPCIVTWVPFNESWGVPDLPDSGAQRHYVQALYNLTKSLDPSRPVVGNDGWESVATDIIGVHDYDSNPARISRRYGKDDAAAQLLKRERPGGRMLQVDGHEISGQPVMLTEFGGIALTDERKETWGYSEARTPGEFLARYQALLRAVCSVPLLAGFCYTQFADTYQEANGLVTADRVPKAPIEAIAAATTGGKPEVDLQDELVWRERLMGRRRTAPSAMT